MMIICMYTVNLSVVCCIHSKSVHVKIYIHVADHLNCRTEKCRSANVTDPFPHCLLTFLVMCCRTALVEIVITPAKDNLEENK
jgi:bifunctional DNase/RNase